ncbi:succinylglutamate desuccinylase/aspartoacylase family protein [Geojedonia litorea]|uniref:Succinylglutamate desuccinylase/aspartoacylase family protein n=1 Tax=Geojedonia litorea TaxID=1268269 RepID=A0ABV9N6C2_9FLAO
MKIYSSLLFSLLLIVVLHSNVFSQQKTISELSSLKELNLTSSGVHHFWLNMGTNTFGQPILVPIIVVQGNEVGPTLGITAAIHGNELNGIPIIHQLAAALDANRLKGRVIAIPGINTLSIELNQRKFVDDEDVNRSFPGKSNGSESEQYAHKIKERILPVFDVHLDLHTASFGRVNTLYARADASNDTILKLAELQQPDIILHSKGKPSFGTTSSATETLRAEAAALGIPSITVEYGNPQVFQKDMINRGVNGILNTLIWLNMYDGNISTDPIKPVYCKKSYWIYTDKGGFLEVPVKLNQLIKKGDPIGIIKNAFGEIIDTYLAPEDGIVIGKSTNPANRSGGRIIHLGILE